MDEQDDTEDDWEMIDDEDVEDYEENKMEERHKGKKHGFSKGIHDFMKSFWGDDEDEEEEDEEEEDEDSWFGGDEDYGYNSRKKRH